MDISTNSQTGKSFLGHNMKTIIQALFKTNILKSAKREWSLNCPKCTKAYAHLFHTYATKFPNADREWKEKYNNEHVKCFINERTQAAWEENELRLLSAETLLQIRNERHGRQLLISISWELILISSTRTRTDKNLWARNGG